MLAVVVTFVRAWAAMLLWPDAGSVCMLRDWLVARPTARLSAIRRADVVIGIVIVAAVIVMTCCEDGSAGRLVVYAMPDAALWLTTLELSAVVDAIVAVVMALSVWHGDGPRAIIRRLPARRAGRARRAIRTQRPSAPANDDDRDPGAAAASRGALRSGSRYAALSETAPRSRGSPSPHRSARPAATAC